MKGFQQLYSKTLQQQQDKNGKGFFAGIHKHSLAGCLTQQEQTWTEVSNNVRQHTNTQKEVQSVVAPAPRAAWIILGHIHKARYFAPTPDDVVRLAEPFESLHLARLPKHMNWQKAVNDVRAPGPRLSQCPEMWRVFKRVSDLIFREAREGQFQADADEKAPSLDWLFGGELQPRDRDEELLVEVYDKFERGDFELLRALFVSTQLRIRVLKLNLDDDDQLLEDDRALYFDGIRLLKKKQSEGHADFLQTLFMFPKTMVRVKEPAPFIESEVQLGDLRLPISLPKIVHVVLFGGEEPVPEQDDNFMHDDE